MKLILLACFTLASSVCFAESQGVWGTFAVSFDATANKSSDYKPFESELKEHSSALGLSPGIELGLFAFETVGVIGGFHMTSSKTPWRLTGALALRIPLGPILILGQGGIGNIFLDYKDSNDLEHKSSVRIHLWSTMIAYRFHSLEKFVGLRMSHIELAEKKYVNNIPSAGYYDEGSLVFGEEF